MAYAVIYARQFHEQLMELEEYDYARVEGSIDVMAENPGLARDYDPPYPADNPPKSFKWYHVPRTYKVIYLTVDDAERVIRCYYLADARMDPLHRFDELEA